MSEYIERQKALDTVFRSHSVEAAHKFLAAIKPADVRSVVRGRWAETEMSGWDGDTAWVCSACGEPWSLIDGTPADNNMNYCPNCGARMEES